MPGGGGVMVSREMEAAWGLVCTGNFQGTFSGSLLGRESSRGGYRIWCPNEQGEGGGVEASASFTMQRMVLGEQWGSRADLG